MAKCMDCGRPLDLPGQKKGRCTQCAAKALAQLLNDPEMRIWEAENRDAEDDLQDALILDGAEVPPETDWGKHLLLLEAIVRQIGVKKYHAKSDRRAGE